MRYVFLVQFCDPLSDYFFLARRCHQVLHGFQYRHNLRSIGVTYPRWIENSVGSCIAFVCHNKEQLLNFSLQPLFTTMREMDCSCIRLVEDGGQEGQFIRTQIKDKYTIAGFNKDNRRRRKRGLEPRMSFPQNHVFEHSHSLDMRKLIHQTNDTEDKDKGMQYLHIYRQYTNKVNGGTFSTYGLSGEENTGTVPLNI